MPASDICRHWTLQIAQLRSGVAKVRRRVLSSDASDVLAQALGVCESLLRDLAGSQLQCEAVKQESSSRAALWDHLYESMPVACLELDGSGTVIQANRSAALLLNTHRNYLKNRLLIYYTDDRQGFAAVLQRLLREREVLTPLMIRPRERAPFEVVVTAMPQAPDAATSWLWFFVPSERTRQVTAGRYKQIPLVPNGLPTDGQGHESTSRNA